MVSSASAYPLRQVLEQQLSHLSSELETLFAEVRDRSRREVAEQLNLAVRRLRLAPDPDELAATLLDAAGAFATGAALFRVKGPDARGEGIRGVDQKVAEDFGALSIPLSAAAALAGAVQSRDPVVAVSAPAEVSPELASLLDHAPDGRVFLFPVVARDRVPALVYAWGNVLGPAIEILAQAAGAVWTALPEPAAADLVSIAPAPAEAASAKPAWESLSPAEQQVHLRARRFARVQVAEMRLAEAGAVQSGRARRDLYDELQEQIDRARAKFHEEFSAGCPSMVDYLHLELLRTLANDDPELLGNSYPGPMV